MQKRSQPIFFWYYDAAAEYDHPPWMEAESQRGTTPTHNNPATQFRNFHHPVAKTSDFGGAAAAILTSQYKLIVDLTGRHRYAKRTVTPVDSDVSLFDILADPGETTNLAPSEPETVAKLTQRLRAWQASVEKSMTGREHFD